MDERHPLSDCRLAFIGAGNMAEALVEGLLSSTPVTPAELRMTNRDDRQRLDRLQARFGVHVAAGKAEVLAGADLVVLAVKPQDAAQALAELAPHLAVEQLLLSVVAGLSMARIRAALGGHGCLVRAMPNTSCSVLQGAIGLACAPEVTAEGRAMARAVFASVGEVVEVDEALMDAVTGLSGSGPAYVYLLAEALADAGSLVGLPPAVAHRLAVQTVIGAGRMLEGGEAPEVLRRRVMSPGGTTVAGLAALREAGFTEAVAAAVARATERSRELAAEASDERRQGA